MSLFFIHNKYCLSFTGANCIKKYLNMTCHFFVPNLKCSLSLRRTAKIMLIPGKKVANNWYACVSFFFLPHIDYYCLYLMKIRFVNAIMLCQTTPFFCRYSVDKRCVKDSYSLFHLFPHIFMRRLKQIKTLCRTFGITDKMAATIDDMLQSVCEKFNIEKLNDFQKYCYNILLAEDFYDPKGGI